MSLHKIDTPQDVRDFIVNTLKEIKQIDPSMKTYNQRKWWTSTGVDEQHPCGTCCCIMGWRWNFDFQKLPDSADIPAPVVGGKYSMNKDSEWITGKHRQSLVEILEVETLEEAVKVYDRAFYGKEKLLEELRKLEVVYWE